MSTLMEPNLAALALLVLKKFIYLEIVFVLALLRVLAGRSWARAASLLSALISLAGIAMLLGPALLNIYRGPFYVLSGQIGAAAGGMALLLAASFPLAMSSAMPGARWRIVDLLHGGLMMVLLVLWMI